MERSDNDPSPWTVVNDYTKTVITVAAALLAFTGTFSTSDRMAAAPVWPLFLCWILLVIAIAAALFSVGRLTGFLKNGKGSYTCLLAANISYFALFAAVLAFLAFAMMATSKERVPVRQTAVSASGQVELVQVGQSIPPFSSGFAHGTRGDYVESVCGARRTLQMLGSTSAIVVGRHDREELSREVGTQFGSNAGLAQQRADWIAELLQDQDLCDAPPVKQVLTVIGGPRKTDLEFREGKKKLRAALSDDRKVEVEGLQFLPESAKPSANESSK